MSPLSLPRPSSRRWQPLRSGLVNLYKYDEEVFHFEKGRILLRGNNGTGKSRVLALQFPFLLDGETASHRVEPDGDPGKRFEWHLLMNKYADRVGYTWLEFGRVEEDGTERYLTIGCGLKAIEGRGITDKWFFVTSQRVGETLSLVSESKVPLRREGLSAVLEAGNSRLFRTAKEYRAAVDDALFQLGERRYEALIGLLIQLRKPQLSREFHESFLSNALTEALAPLDPEALELIAEAYRELDDQRTELNNYQSAHKAVAAFLAEYSIYAKTAARRRAQTVRSTHSTYEEIQRELRKEEGELREAGSRLENAVQRLAKLDEELSAAHERVRTLETSPEMRSARELQAARENAVKQEANAKEAQSRAERAGAREREAKAKHSAAENSVVEQQQKRNEAVARANSSAKAAVFASLPSDQELATRRQAIKELDKEERTLLQLRSNLNAAAKAQAEASEHKTETEKALQEHSLHLQQEACKLVESARVWRSSLVHLKVPESWIHELSHWSENPANELPFETEVRAVISELHEELHRRTGQLEEKHAGLQAKRAELESERRQLEAGAHHGPPERPGVNSERRAHAPGAPLWKVIDFEADVSAADRAGIEAALEASGILDAWLSPDGSLISGENETLLLANADLTQDGLGLSRWLKPAVDRKDAQASFLSDSLVRRVLCLVGSEEGFSQISSDGSWRLGPLAGKWTKTSAHHIGQGAREAEQRRRLEELGRCARALDEEEHGIQEELRSLNLLKRESALEESKLPSTQSFRNAESRVEAARQVLTQATARLLRAEGAAIEARERHRTKQAEYDELREALGLRAWEGGLRDLLDATESCARALLTLAGETNRLQDRETALAEAAASTTQAAEDYASALADQQHLQKEAAAARALSDELDATVGAKAEEVLRRLEDAKTAKASLKREHDSVNTTREDARVLEATLRGKVRTLEEKLREGSERRENAITGLQGFVATGLLRTADAELTDTEERASVTAWVELARRIEASLSVHDASDIAWDRRSKTIYNHFTVLQTELGPLSYRPEGHNEGEFFVVSVPIHQKPCSINDVENLFQSEIESRIRLLEAKEREIIENHLIGEISAHIHDRLHAAEQWVEFVNRELDERPTGTGMKLCFDWIVNEEGPIGFPEARRLLMRAAATWSEQDRELVSTYLHHRLRTERSGNPHKTWNEVLVAAFDYRAWHRFVVKRQQDGNWQRLTKRTFGTGSGGEKALMLTMPQFAAAGAHYRSASPTSPRLIFLDEAFAGIDNENRGHAMGLLTKFDLDLVMTSEREWGCYPTVPGISIYQIAARAGVDAVLATRWVWDGSRRYKPEESGELLQ